MPDGIMEPLGLFLIVFFELFIMLKNKTIHSFKLHHNIILDLFPFFFQIDI